VGRPAKFTETAILNAALDLVADGDATSASVTAVADALGAPSGSIYHRFASRDLLLARLWVRTVSEFQRGFLDALDNSESDAAARAAMLHTPRWSSEHPSSAALLTRYSRRDLVKSWPDQLGSELSALNAPVSDALSAFALDRFGEATRDRLIGVRFALVEIPYSLARTHIQERSTVTSREEEFLVAAGMAVLDRLRRR
jgi:AcrR family transcriptional regulator